MKTQKSNNHGDWFLIENQSKTSPRDFLSVVDHNFSFL